MPRPCGSSFLGSCSSGWPAPRSVTVALTMSSARKNSKWMGPRTVHDGIAYKFTHHKFGGTENTCPHSHQAQIRTKPLAKEGASAFAGRRLTLLTALAFPEDRGRISPGGFDKPRSSRRRTRRTVVGTIRRAVGVIWGEERPRWVPLRQQISQPSELKDLPHVRMWTGEDGASRAGFSPES